MEPVGVHGRLGAFRGTFEMHSQLGAEDRPEAFGGCMMAIETTDHLCEVVDVNIRRIGLVVYDNPLAASYSKLTTVAWVGILPYRRWHI